MEVFFKIVVVTRSRSPLFCLLHGTRLRASGLQKAAGQGRVNKQSAAAAPLTKQKAVDVCREAIARMKKKLIIDVDTGVDDAQAIMVALAAPSVEILGITCCHGNTTLDHACKNTLRVLKVCNRLDIPVYRGCAEPLLARKLHAGDFHGKDGLGDAPDPDAPGLELLQKEKAVQAMIKLVNENPGEVTLVATAPLTNLAVAVKLDPSFPEKLKALYIMGGNTECTSCALISAPGETPRCVESLTSWPTLRLPTSCWTATPAPPTSPPGSSAAGTACRGSVITSLREIKPRCLT
ncbi:probable uridine nucleosidase 2 isoform X4 [Xiphias gladius]|uniref:probable uridine nucleosidase 2 isoform X4 n=1 Tax=Xiphias gladius TaxID=8245 RepID=UPI001A98B469|nr:probable uridine nucleosidase 2 isoform X4 [Xiphias gladius]